MDVPLRELILKRADMGHLNQRCFCNHYHRQGEPLINFSLNLIYILYHDAVCLSRVFIAAPISGTSFGMIQTKGVSIAALSSESVVV